MKRSRQTSTVKAADTLATAPPVSASRAVQNALMPVSSRPTVSWWMVSVPS